nr:titin homolog [Misgurnus anguillicaudatus]
MFSCAFLFVVRVCLFVVRLCLDCVMNPVIVFVRGPGRILYMDKFLSGLDNGSTLLFIKKNRPVVTIRRDLSAHELTVPSVPESQEEALGEPCGQRERETEDAEVQSSVSGAAAPQTPAVQTAEEACPDEKTMIEDEDFEEEASESSSLHEPSSLSGSGSDSSSLSKGSSSVVADRSGDEPLAIQPAACLPWIGRVVSRADLKPPAPRKDGPPSAPAVVTAEEACPDEKTMIEDEDFEEEASESSSLHEPSSLSGSGSDSSSLSKGSSSVVADRSGDEPLAIQPAACLPWIGRVVSRADLKPPAPRKDGPPSAPAVVTAEEACPDEKAVIKDEDFEEEASESSSLHEPSSVSGSGSDSSSLSKGSSSVVADRSGDEPLAIQPAACLPWIGRVVSRADPPAPRKGFPQWSDLWYRVDLNGSREKSTPPSSTQAAGTHQENSTETKDLKARAEILVSELVRFSGCGSVSAEFRFKLGQMLVSFALTSEAACTLARETLDREMLRLRREESSPQTLIHLYRFIKRFPMIFVGMKCQLHQWVLEDLEDPDLVSEDEEGTAEIAPADAPAEGPLLPAPLAVPEPPPGLLFLPSPAPQPSVEVLSSPAPLAVPEPPPGLLFFPAPSPALQPSVEFLSSHPPAPAPQPSVEVLSFPAPLAVSEPPPGLLFFPAPAPQPSVEVLSSRPPAPAPQPSVEVLSFPAPLAVSEPPPGLLFFPAPAPQPSVEVLSSPPPAPAPQPSVEVLTSPPPAPAPQPSVEVLTSPPPAPAPQPSLEVLSSPAPLAVPEPPPGLLFFRASAPAPQPSVEVLSSPPPAPAPQPSVEVLSFPAPLAVPEPPPGLLFFPAPQPSVEVLSSPPPAPAPQPSVEVLSFPAPLAVPEPPPGLLFFPAPQPSVDVLSSPVPAPAPQPSVEVLTSPPPALAPQPLVEVLTSPPPAPAQQPSLEVLSSPASLAVPEPPPGLLFFPPPAPAPQPSVEVLSSPPPAPAPQHSVEVLSSPASLAVPEPPPGLLLFPPPAPAPQPSCAPPQLQIPSFYQQKNADAVKDVEVGNTPSSSQLSPPRSQAPLLASPPSRKRRAPSCSQQSIRVQGEAEVSPKRARLCPSISDIKAQHSSPYSLSAQVKPPPAQLSPPHGQAPPLASPPSRKRRAPSCSQDEMEPTPKRAKLYGLSARVTPPLSQTPSSSQVDFTKALNVISDNIIKNFIY